ncbi:kelch motif domain-containing protein [Sarocladium implicatum]|nr:kelch motif domain-containing protein [Sarocladium implicatum]
MLSIPSISRASALWLALSRTGIAQGSSKVADVDNSPPTDEFLRRGDFVAAKLGSYVYFNGGEGSQEDAWRFTNPINATLSIDVGKSWAVEDVEVIVNSYGDDHPQVMPYGSAMVDNSSDAFYTWGGRVSFNEDLRDTNLWRFDADGSGGGEWTDATPKNKNDKFFELKRSAAASWTSTNDAGFIFGGNVFGATEYEAERKAGAGYRTFNFTTQEWNEYYDTPYSPDDGLLFQGRALFVPDFGPNGFIFLLGGFLDDSDPSSGLDFRTLHFLDPVERKWYKQVTTGKVPGSRSSPCIAGASSEDGKFDIFMFGGSDMSSSDFGDVYVLSLPGFHWAIASGSQGSQYKRSKHVCTTVGQRQLLSFGGRQEFGVNETESWQSRDPLPQGVGIYDMSAWKWQDKYDADAKRYEQHSELKSWYDDGGLDDVKWSKEVKPFFASADPGSNGGSGGNSGGDSDSDGNSDDDSDSGPNAGAIAGGVVGGIAVIALAVGIWFLYRRRQHRRQDDVVQTSDFTHSSPGALEMEHTPTPSKAGSPPVPYHKGYGHSEYEPSPATYSVQAAPQELPAYSTEVYEMGDSERR